MQRYPHIITNPLPGRPQPYTPQGNHQPPVTIRGVQPTHNVHPINMRAPMQAPFVHPTPIGGNIGRVSNVQATQMMAPHIIGSQFRGSTIPNARVGAPVHTTARMSVVSDKEVSFIGSYFSNQAKKTICVQQLNPRQTSGQVHSVGKIVQATLKDIIPTEIIKINSDYMTDSQALFDTSQGTASIEDLTRLNGIGTRLLVESGNLSRDRSHSSILAKGNSFDQLKNKIKISVYKSPDVVIREPEYIVDGPKLTKDHILRVNVQGRPIPNQRPVQQRNIGIPIPRVFNQVQTPSLHIPGATLVQSQQLPSINYVNTFSKPSVYLPTVYENTAQDLLTNQLTSPQIRGLITRAQTPSKTLTESVAFSDHSAIRQLTSTFAGESYTTSATKPYLADSFANRDIKGRDIQPPHEFALPESSLPKGMSKLPFERLTEPLSFDNGGFKPQARPGLATLLGTRPPGASQFQPHDPVTLLTD